MYKDAEPSNEYVNLLCDVKHSTNLGECRLVFIVYYHVDNRVTRRHATPFRPHGTVWYEVMSQSCNSFSIWIEDWNFCVASFSSLDTVVKGVVHENNFWTLIHWASQHVVPSINKQLLSCKKLVVLTLQYTSTPSDAMAMHWVQTDGSLSVGSLSKWAWCEWSRYWCSADPRSVDSHLSLVRNLA